MEKTKGDEAMTQIIEDYAKRYAEDYVKKYVENYAKDYTEKKILEREEEVAKSLLLNGASIDLIRKVIPTLSLEFIEELSQQLTTVGQ